MKLKGHTEKLIVVDLEADSLETQVIGTVLSADIVAVPQMLRIHPQYVEVTTKEYTRKGNLRRKSRKFWWNDLLIMNDALYHISHPLAMKYLKRQ